MPSNARGGLASLAEPLQFFATTAFTGLLIVGFAPHLFAKSASFAELTKAANSFLNRFSGPNP